MDVEDTKGRKGTNGQCLEANEKRNQIVRIQGKSNKKTLEQKQEMKKTKKKGGEKEKNERPNK